MLTVTTRRSTFRKKNTICLVCGRNNVQYIAYIKFLPHPRSIFIRHLKFSTWHAVKNEEQEKKITHKELCMKLRVVAFFSPLVRSVLHLSSLYVGPSRVMWPRGLLVLYMSTAALRMTGLCLHPALTAHTRLKHTDDFNPNGTII